VALNDVRALVCDVFGTIVDWRGSLIRAGEALARSRGLTVDWPAFADEWRRAGYHDAIRRIVAGEEPYVSSDELFHRKLAELAPKYGLQALSSADLDDLLHIWRRLDPWPDSVAGLTRLKAHYTIGTLSNGTFATLTAMAKYGGLPWDCIIATDLGRVYKPQPEAYRLAPALLDLQAGSVMLVAAHSNDLRAARSNGFATAFVARPLEWGPDGPREPVPAGEFDVSAADLVELATKLGA
jgi:2-haloacid dehalogenase